MGAVNRRFRDGARLQGAAHRDDFPLRRSVVRIGGAAADVEHRAEGCGFGLAQRRGPRVLPLIISAILGYSGLDPNTQSREETLGFEGPSNTAYGTGALASSELSGTNNAAFGRLAAGGVTTGNYNLAFGSQALERTTTGFNNTGIGYLALFGNVTGRANVAIGTEALRNNTAGVANIAIGGAAGFNSTTGSRNIFIGSRGLATDDKVIRIGNANHTNTYISGKIHGDGSGLNGVRAVYQ